MSSCGTPDRQRDSSGAWTQLDAPAIPHSFHADWIDPDGGFWGVGGDFDHTPLTANGFLVYRGNRARACDRVARASAFS